MEPKPAVKKDEPKPEAPKAPEPKAPEIKKPDPPKPPVTEEDPHAALWDMLDAKLPY